MESPTPEKDATADNLFQGKARLEVSGILRGTTRRINSRIKARMGQTRQSDNLALTAYVVVVEFGTPRAKVCSDESSERPPSGGNASGG
jgi:hypothetical protein